VARERPVAGEEVPARKLESSDGPAPAQATSIAASPLAEAPKSEVKSEVALPPPATLEIAAPPAAPENAALPATVGVAPASAPRTIQKQVVEATGMADLVTAIGAGREAAKQSDNPAAGSDETSDTGKTASASPGKEDNLVALVLARPEISSLSDLNYKTIAIEAKQSASSGRVSAALMAVGAADVQFSEGQAGAIERLISGEVPAAVVTLISPEAAEWFPDIPGFRTFRVPLGRKARL
jgi:ABC-type phosphate/phosphonate transport system substrate-binding protein